MIGVGLIMSCFLLIFHQEAVLLLLFEDLVPNYVVFLPQPVSFVVFKIDLISHVVLTLEDQFFSKLSVFVQIPLCPVLFQLLLIVNNWPVSYSVLTLISMVLSLELVSLPVKLLFIEQLPLSHIFKVFPLESLIYFILMLQDSSPFVENLLFLFYRQRSLFSAHFVLKVGIILFHKVIDWLVQPGVSVVIWGLVIYRWNPVLVGLGEVVFGAPIGDFSVGLDLRALEVLIRVPMSWRLHLLVGYLLLERLERGRSILKVPGLCCHHVRSQEFVA
jgi:hypothetical protein